MAATLFSVIQRSNVRGRCSPSVLRTIIYLNIFSLFILTSVLRSRYNVVLIQQFFFFSLKLLLPDGWGRKLSGLISLGVLQSGWAIDQSITTAHGAGSTCCTLCYTNTHTHTHTGEEWWWGIWCSGGTLVCRCQ